MSWFRSLFVFPNKVATLRPREASRPEDAEVLWLDTEEGRVESWFLPATKARAPLIVFAHGNGELIDDWPRALAPYREMGMHLLLVEYRGYGRSAGRPSEAAVVADAVRFVDQSAARSDVDASRIAYHGRSIGGGVACALALARKPRALILMSTFTSVPDVVARYWIPRGLVADRFDNAAALRTLQIPVLIIHGERDNLIPVVHAKRLAALHHRSELHVDPKADHNRCPSDWPWFWERTRRYLERAGMTPT